jgi:membrane protein insertase Oxa1/YidC/SpoIIIJ
MPYHKQALGMDWSELNSGLKILLMSSVKSVAVGALNTGIACFFILKFAAHQSWAKYCLFILNAFWFLAMLLIGLWISRVTNTHTPWPIPAIVLLITLIGFILSFKKVREDE